ncbi:MAG: DUF1003 domain-containing protein [Iphinoe sp. HA4291-MV1]|jgi:uncharacterized membrane protein|nr:DUF1003 domain-containing protein [Iphinoe sp. HA4291-MV1]
MSNQQTDTDRERAEHDYQVNVKAELEVELLHDKMNLLREVEIVDLVQMLKQQRLQLEKLEALLQQKLDSSTAIENSLNPSQSDDKSDD